METQTRTGKRLNLFFLLKRFMENLLCSLLSVHLVQDRAGSSLIRRCVSYPLHYYHKSRSVCSWPDAMFSMRGQETEGSCIQQRISPLPGPP
ncbi:hypothetical protein GDO78_018942 [Eleutherodactylus coqui]|uniref:Uncharacterized protein n=1 Tax=Eleutherodactylus coqui TaxID=57060 RepID=A0A8J6E6L0_ELECQ|nr:hypothetical protein GDO78_018942 [Eleutherodactylus coqui]